MSKAAAVNARRRTFREKPTSRQHSDLSKSNLLTTAFSKSLTPRATRRANIYGNHVHLQCRRHIRAEKPSTHRTRICMHTTALSKLLSSKWCNKTPSGDSRGDNTKRAKACKVSTSGDLSGSVTRNIDPPSSSTRCNTISRWSAGELAMEIARLLMQRSGCSSHTFAHHILARMSR